MAKATPYRLSITEPNTYWMQKASCTGMDSDIFFPERNGKPIIGGNNIYNKARKVCEKCPVQSDCLNYAFHFNMVEFGMFGGLTPPARKKQFARMRRLMRSLVAHTENNKS